MHWLVAQPPALVIAGLLLAVVFRDVSRARVERFARRQRLAITVRNGPLVIDYLAATRRWRAAGFLAGLALQYGATYTQRQPFELNLVGPAIGWFLGAIIAEWRLEAQRSPAPRRIASLEVRRLVDYLPHWLIVANLALWIGTLAMGVVQLLRPESVMSTLVPALCLSAVVTPIVALVVRRVLVRPQSVAAPDLLATDDALRSRSLHVLGGSSLAANGVLLALVTSSADVVGVGFPSDGIVELVSVVAGLVAPLYGWLAATIPFATRRGMPTGNDGALT